METFTLVVWLAGAPVQIGSCSGMPSGLVPGLSRGQCERMAEETLKESHAADFQIFGFKIPKKGRFPDARAYCVSSKPVPPLISDPPPNTSAPDLPRDLGQAK
jgi:hypothetical protein